VEKPDLNVKGTLPLAVTLASVGGPKSRLDLPFWYRLTHYGSPGQGPLNG